MTVADMLGVVVIGLLGSGHCLGMCAPFSLAVSAGASGAGRVVARQIAYQLGKATAYMFIGLLLLLASEAGVALTGSVGRMQTVLAWIAGGAMIAAGAAYALEWRGLSGWFAGERGGIGGRLCGLAGELWRSPSLARALLVGWMNGFLPCGLALTALLYLASFGSVAGVAAGAYVFGFSTMPALLAAALLGHRVSVRARRWFVRAGGVLLVAFGVLTLVRGDASVHHWFHEHTVVPGGPMDVGDDHSGHEGH
ncbi:MAG: sulfite exporter TauE/SafE family protein [Verrucomicrobiota bacterium]